MTELEQLKMWADGYIFSKQEADKFKKQADSLNTNIKQAMENLGMEDVELDDGSRVHYSVTRKSSIDEEKLIEYLHKYAPDTECIKTREYIDMDTLESEIYNEKLPTEMVAAMETCTHVKEIPTLTIKSAKKGKKGD